MNEMRMLSGKNIRKSSCISSSHNQSSTDMRNNNRHSIQRFMMNRAANCSANLKGEAPRSILMNKTLSSAISTQRQSLQVNNELKSLTSRANDILVDTFRTSVANFKNDRVYQQPKSTKSSQERLNRKISLKTILNEEAFPKGVV